MTTLPLEFRFQPEPRVAAWVEQELRAAADASPRLRDLARRFRSLTSTRLFDFVERVTLPVDGVPLIALGFWEARPGLWVHQGGLFPVIQQGSAKAVSLRVDDVVSFARQNGVVGTPEGDPFAPHRRLLVFEEGGVSTWAVERRGGRLNDDLAQSHPGRVAKHREAFRARQRAFDDEARGFEHLLELARSAVAELGPAYASDIFFEAEREYWQGRNDAGSLQKARQDQLGVGWGNHDHHTYRSSREHFRALIGVLEALGMNCRERFYAGAEAGWGAQVLDHPDSGVMVFADVDMSPSEVMVDFAHLGLEPRPTLGTVGLWCKLHGEAMLEAGMHHLEGQFDFRVAVQWFEDHGGSMPPFSTYSYLKQCFTVGQRWAVSPARLRQAVSRGWVTREQAETFLLDGAIGSHLEILERNFGFKGFNQKGISEIIAATDPRRAAAE
jgi:hypothetical protein